MNFIEEKFFNLINEFKEKSVTEIYEHMVFNFKNIPYETQKSIETFFKEFPYWGGLDVENEDHEYLLLKAKIFKNHFKDYVWLFNHLGDEFSKFLLFAILNNFYNFDFYNLKIGTENVFKHYFDLNLVPKCKNEVFVDLGAYTGDTVLDFVMSYGEKCYKKIYCYDITESSIDLMKKNLDHLKNIKLKHKAVCNKNGVIKFDENASSTSANKLSKNGKIKVEAVKLDDDITDKITTIKMDIEGAEQDAIKGAKNHIKMDNPKLLISVYHNNVDLFKIPKMIYGYNKNYNFHLRYFGGCIYATEIVLIALPKQKK